MCIPLFCTGLSHLVDTCCYVSPSFTTSHCCLGIFRSMVQASCRPGSRVPDTTLVPLTINTLRVVYNKDLQPWGVLLQLTSNPHSVVFCLRYHNRIRQQDLIVVTVHIQDERLELDSHENTFLLQEQHGK